MATLGIQPEEKDNRYKRLGDVTSGSWSLSADFTPHSIGSSDGGTGSASFTTTATGESDFTFARDIEALSNNNDMVGKINSLTLGSGVVQINSDTLLSRLNTTKRFGPSFGGNLVYSYFNGYVPSDASQAYSGFQMVDSGAYWSNVTTDIGSGRTRTVFPGVTGSGTNQFSGVAGASITSFNDYSTYMIDAGNNKILHFIYYDDTSITEFGVGDFVNPAFIVLDSDANVYVGDNGADSSHAKRITQYDDSGAQIARWTFTQNFTSIAADETGWSYGILAATDGTRMYQISSDDGTIGTNVALPKNTISNPKIALVARGPVWMVGTSMLASDKGTNNIIVLEFDDIGSAFVNQQYSLISAGSRYGSTSTITGFSAGGSFLDNTFDDDGNDFSGEVFWVSENVYDSNGTLTGNAVTGYMNDQPTLSATYLSYLSACIPAPFGFHYEANDKLVAYPGWTGTVWDYIKQLASATNTQVYALANDVWVYPASGYNTYSIEQFVSGNNATITANVSGLSRKIQVVSQNTSLSLGGNYSGFGGDVVYDAYTDNNNVITIDVGQTSIVNVQTPHWLTGVLTNLVCDVHYQIQDSNGKWVAANDWVPAGGSVRASVAADGQNINLAITGPIYSISGYQGPFSFSRNANASAYLWVEGWGVLTDAQTITLYTGAAEEFVSQDVGETLTNPFIESISQAYDRGAWATYDSAGPNIQLTFTVPSSSFQWSDGDRILYRDQLWRVTSYSISSGQSSVTAVPYTTVDDAQQIWRGSTVAQYDEFWSTPHGRWGGDYRVYDKKFRPLWNPRSLTPATRVSLYLDTDSVPYWIDGTAGTPQQWISIDTDGVPYYSATGDSYGTWLDIDGHPYYAIG